MTPERIRSQSVRVRLKRGPEFAVASLLKNLPFLQRCYASFQAQFCPANQWTLNATGIPPRQPHLFHPVFNRFNEAVWPNLPSSATFNIRSSPCSSDSILLPCFSPCTLVQVTKSTGRYLFAHALPDSTATP